MPGQTKKEGAGESAHFKTENDQSNNTPPTKPRKGRFIDVDFTGVPNKKPLEPDPDLVTDDELANRRVLHTLGMDFPEWTLYGLAGDIVKRLLPETETHPAALLIHILIRFGNIIGRTAYVVMEGTRHYANEFAVVVGKSSKSRKGTANDRIADVFVGVDSSWESNCQTSGFGSGEAVINSVRDDQQVTVKGKSEIVPGIEDKRLFVREGEFSKMLIVAQREGNLFSTVLRDAWDGKELRNNVKHSPLVSTAPHISSVCDITMHELRSSLKEEDRYNGFANRFIFLFVERTRLIPESRVQFDWAQERIQLRRAIAFAKSRGRMTFTEAARTMWRRKYEGLTQEIDGSIGAITDRSEAHVRRLSMIFALIDCSDKIRSEHLNAALELWKYSMRSVKHIFRTVVVSRYQKDILDFLDTRGEATASQIREELFHRNRIKEDIADDLNILKKAGLIEDELTDDEGGETIWRCSYHDA